MQPQGCIIVLLFIIASVLFPPLLLAIPVILLGMLVAWWGDLSKEREAKATQQKQIESAILAIEAEKRAADDRLAQRRRKIDAQRNTQEVGAILVALINDTAERSTFTAVEIANEIRERTLVEFGVFDGKVHITDEQLHQIEPHLPRIREYCASLE